MMATYNLSASQSDRIRLDEKAARDGYDDAHSQYPDVIEERYLHEHANFLVDLALAQNEHLTDDEQEYRARYVETYVKAYTETVREDDLIELTNLWSRQKGATQMNKEDELLLALCREAGDTGSDEECIQGARSNHDESDIRDASQGDVAALVRLRTAFGLPIFS